MLPLATVPTMTSCLLWKTSLAKHEKYVCTSYCLPPNFKPNETFSNKEGYLTTIV